MDKSNQTVFSFYITLALLFSSCGAEVRVGLYNESATGEDSALNKVLPVPSLTLKEADFGSPDLSRDVYISIPFAGDSNNNSTVKMYYCSIKLQNGCDPLASNFITLLKSETNFKGVVNIESSSLTPGDFLKYKIRSIDDDGVVDGDENGYLLIPYSDSTPRKIRQLGKFTLGTNKKSAGGRDRIYASVIGSDGALYVAGSTTSILGEIRGGGSDALIMKLTPKGILDKSFGINGVFQLGMITTSKSDQSDILTSLVIDSSGNLFAGGNTLGSLGGLNAGGRDAFIIKLNSETGVLDSSFGDGDGVDNDGVLQVNALNSADSSLDDYIQSLAVDQEGNLFAGGYTLSSLGGVNAGDEDAFILKVNGGSGLFDSDFGDGDGTDNDGILQINSVNSADASLGERARSITLDTNGNIFLAGESRSSLGGTSAGNYDGFILKASALTGALELGFGDGDGADSDGILQINAQNSANASSVESIDSIVLDSSGNLFAGGRTNTALSGTGAGSYDGFILKISTESGLLDSNFGDGDGADNDGILQINTPNANNLDSIHSITLGSDGSLFATGITRSSYGGTNVSGVEDIFIVKINTESGILDPNFGDGDGVDNDGIVQINAINSGGGSLYDNPSSVVLDSKGNLFVSGYTKDSLSGLNAGDDDVFILKLSGESGALDQSFGNNNDGILQINTQGSEKGVSDEYIQSIALDSNGNLYIAGYGYSFLGATTGGYFDGFIVKMNAQTGALDSEFGNGDGSDNDGILQINSMNSGEASGDDVISSIALDSVGNIFAAGYTKSSLGGLNAGARDGFILKVNGASGALDSDFGDGDGTDNDGILQINVAKTAAGRAGSDDLIMSIALDSNDNVFAGGNSGSALGSNSMGGQHDVIVIKVEPVNGNFDPNFGDGDGVDNDGIMRLNRNNTVETLMLSELVSSIVVDSSGSVFVAGNTRSSCGGVNSGNYDGFILKIDATSGLLDSDFGDGDGRNNDGIVQINSVNAGSATGYEAITTMALHSSGNLFIGGHTASSLGGTLGGGYDGFILKLDAISGLLDGSFGDGDGVDNDGIVQLNATNSADASGYEFLYSIALDSFGNIFAVGTTGGAFGGDPAGGADTYIAKFNAISGTLDSDFGDGDGLDNNGILQINSQNSNDASETDYMTSILLDSSGSIFIGGYTYSSLGEANAGARDAFTMMIPYGVDGI